MAQNLSSSWTGFLDNGGRWLSISSVLVLVVITLVVQVFIVGEE